MNQDDYNWLAADYVLGVMRGPEKAAFEANAARTSLGRLGVGLAKTPQPD